MTSILLATSLLRSVYAASSNATEIEGWVSDPNGRGTFTLVSSCVLTLGVCVWSAMHLNIPPRDESPWRYWMRNAWWSLIGVFGPELVVFIAWKQYLSAKALMKALQENGDEEEHLLVEEMVPQEETKLDRRQDYHRRQQTAPWTIVHGFFAGMGGFAVDLDLQSAARPQIFGESCQRLTLSPRGILLLAQCGVLPVVSRKDIEDKSKSDSLAKCLACIQAGWMAVQIIGRLIAELPISLLEINTLGHVLCALIIYILWWYKPRQINQPVVLQGDWVESISAYMYMSSVVSGKIDGVNDRWGRTLKKPELASLAYLPQMSLHPSVVTEPSSRPPEANNRGSTGDLDDPVSRCAHLKGVTREESKESKDLIFSNNPTGIFELLETPERPVKNEFSSDKEEPAGVSPLRWVLAAEAVHKHPAIRRRFQFIEGTQTREKALRLQETHLEELVTVCSGNWSTKGLLPGIGGVLMGTILWSASMTFGGLHAAAWNAHFPTTAEQWLWRISSLYMIGSGLIWSAINFTAQTSSRFDQFWERLRRPTAPWVSSIPLGIIFLACGTCYAFSRAFLVIEAFISIRRLPDGVYNTPSWTQEIPHL